MFEDRKDAANQLAERLAALPLKNPVVLCIPRGGIVIGAILARRLGAELDVVLARKLRAPSQPELALGAIGENGDVYLTSFASSIPGATDDYLAGERDHQRAEIKRRQQIFRSVRPAVEVTGRSVIVTDDGIATGSTMLAALHVVQARRPFELIVAVPVAPPEAVDQLKRQCDRVECLLAPRHLGAIGAFYRDFDQVDDDEVVRLLREAASPRGASPE